MADPTKARAQSNRTQVRPVALGAVLAIAATALFLSTLTSANSYDSIAYSLDVERTLITGYTGTLVHDYHAAWNPVGFAVAATVPGLRSEPLLAFQLVNSVAAGLLVGLMAAWLLHATNRLLLSTGAALLVPNVAYWHHATDGEPHALAGLLLFVAFLLAPLEKTVSRPNLRLVAASLAMGSAIAVHLATVVVSPVLALALLVTARWRRGATRAASFLLIAATLALVPYFIQATFIEGLGMLSSFRRMVSGVLSPSWPQGEYFLVAPWSPLAEFWAVVRSFAPTTALLRGVPLALTALGAAGAVLAWRRGLRAPAVAFVIFAAQLAFFASYNLASQKFIGVQVAFLVPAGLLGWWELQRRVPKLARLDALWPALALVLIVINFQGTVRPEMQPERNRHLQASRAIGAGLNPEDAVLMLGLDSDRALKVYVPYFARREALILDFLGDGKKLGGAELQRRLTWRLERVAERGGVVHATRGVLEDSPGRRRYLERHGLDSEWFARALPAASVQPSVTVDGEPFLRALERIPPILP